MCVLLDGAKARTPVACVCVCACRVHSCTSVLVRVGARALGKGGLAWENASISFPEFCWKISICRMCDSDSVWHLKPFASRHCPPREGALMVC